MSESGIDIAALVESTLDRDEALKCAAYDLTLQNVVCTAWTGAPVDILLACMACYARFDKAVFPAGVSRSRAPQSTNSIFQSGQIVSVGNKTPEDALLSIYLFVTHLVRKLGRDLRVLNFQVENMVGSVGLGHRLDLDYFYQQHGGHCTYIPDNFPGLYYAPPLTEEQQALQKLQPARRGRRGARPGGRKAKKSGAPKMVHILFPSGKILYVGYKTRAQMRHAHESFLPLIREFREGVHQHLLLPEQRITQRIEAARRGRRAEQLRRKLTRKAPAQRRLISALGT